MHGFTSLWPPKTSIRHAPLFHITDARVPMYNADAMTTKLCSHFHGFLLQSRCAFETDPVDNHDVVRMLGQTLKLKYKTKLCHTPLHLQPSSEEVLWTIWKSASEDECIARKRALDASPGDWAAIFESFDRINQLFPLCNAKWIQHILRFCNPRGCCARVSVLEPVIGCYMVFAWKRPKCTLVWWVKLRSVCLVFGGTVMGPPPSGDPLVIVVGSISWLC